LSFHTISSSSAFISGFLQASIFSAAAIFAEQLRRLTGAADRFQAEELAAARHSQPSFSFFDSRYFRQQIFSPPLLVAFFFEASSPFSSFRLIFVTAAAITDTFSALLILSAFIFFTAAEARQ